MNHNQMLRDIQQLEFAALDLNLYLDTHPDSKEALIDFNTITRQLANKKRLYELNYGPLTNFGYAPSKYPWEWTKSPWPWENY